MSAAKVTSEQLAEAERMFLGRSGVLAVGLDTGGITLLLEREDAALRREAARWAIGKQFDVSVRTIGPIEPLT
jgi:hypothetical protein